MEIALKELSTAERQYYLQHIVAPRPICFASTIDKEGNVNLSPFSFFNLFSSNPPIVVFSPARRIRDNTTIVTYDMVQQTSLSSCEYPKGVDEFIKAGFTKEKAKLVKPPMVKESKAKFECSVLEIKELGTEGGAGNLIICEVLYLHLDNSLFTDNGNFDQTRLQLVARLGGDWYCKVGAENLFQVKKPNKQLGIGIDALPESIKHSKILSGNHLGQLANVEASPVIETSFDDAHLKNIFQYYSIDPVEMEKEIHLYAAKLLEEGKVSEAWQVLLASENII
jgi:flavin reductase (DIM6/NTAB) family NADH-FMN oxidoreductase RutF